MNGPLSWLRGRLQRRARVHADQWQAGVPAPKAAISLGRKAILLGALALFIWAAFAPLDQGVPASGFVKVESSRKAIQHLRGGVVDEILVREGDKVVEGQPLIKLNEVQAMAQQGMVDSQLVGLVALADRLAAERQSRDAVVFSRFLTDRGGSAQVAEAMAAQGQLFMTRRAAVSGELGIMAESLAGLDQQLLGLAAQERAKGQQLALYKEELEALKPVYEKGFVPRSRIFELERAISYLAGGQSEDMATMGRIRSQMAELRLKQLQVKEVYRKEVETQSTDVQRQIAELRERSNASRDELARVVLRAPVAGVVVSLDIHTVGGVINPGQKLMEIVPTGGSLVVELTVPTQLVDGLVVGQSVDLHFPALDTTDLKSVVGELIYVSADRQLDPRTEMPYYVARVKLTAASENRLSGHTLLPGMPADAVVKTGERTLMAYLLRPVLTRMRGAMKER